MQISSRRHRIAASCNKQIRFSVEFKRIEFNSTDWIDQRNMASIGRYPSQNNQLVAHSNELIGRRRRRRRRWNL